MDWSEMFKYLAPKRTTFSFYCFDTLKGREQHTEINVLTYDGIEYVSPLQAILS